MELIHSMRLAFPGLIQALAEGATVVTPTPQLASVAIEQFNRAQLKSGKEAWNRPAIYSLDAWMVNCWQQARFGVPNAPLLLSGSQERELWRQIIEQDRPDLFDVRAMAGMSQRASRILAEYQIQTDGEAWSEHADAEKFLRWHAALQKRLKAENWITRSELWRLLPHWISKGAVNTGAIAFAALTSVSPGLKTLSRAIGDGVQLVGITTIREPTRATASQHDSIALEMEHAARAVRHLLEVGHDQSIGILVVDLAAHQSELVRILREVLYPASAPGDHIHVQCGKQISHPLISNAMLLLELAEPRIHYAAAGAILRSPFIDGAREERSLRALADNKLRRARELDFSAAEITSAAWDCPILFQVLGRIGKMTNRFSSEMRLPAWSAAFSDMLEAAKWPAVENITEAERRAVDQWNRGLSELASLGLVSPPVKLNQARAQLQAILNGTAEIGDWSAPVQIFDANTSEGIEFDHSFVINASEEAWPVPAALSPLIPYKLQRLQQVPASNPESAGEERLRKTIALFTSAPTVHVSYTGSLSPLMTPHTVLPVDLPVWDGLTIKESYEPVELESLEDNQAPPLRLSEGVHGGAGIIKSQSLCPFKAFAEYRLNAQGDDEACFGFDALERGECAHKALEYVWRELGSQDQLKALSPDQVWSMVEKHVNQAVRNEASSGPLRSLTSIAERERLITLIVQWLNIERQRAKPFIVERLEDKREVELSGLKLKLRIDRIDRLPNHNLVLIDYKSGAQSTRKLTGDRPKEPQLLVYAAVLDEPIDGIYFGELRNRRARPVGHGSEKHFPKQRGTEEHDDWDEFLDNSKKIVHRLAAEFKSGAAAVNPQPGACAYCRVKPLCRVGTSASDEGEE